MATDNGKTVMPPYVPFRTFLNFLTKLEQLVPQRIDRSFLNRSYSGVMGSQLITSLRFLGLVEGDENRTTAELNRLVHEQATRKQLLGELLHKRYEPIFTDVGDLSKATHLQLEQAFKQLYKVDGDTRRKVISFFVHAAQYADIPVSMYIRTANNPGSSRTVTRTVSKKAKARQKDTHSTNPRVTSAPKTEESYPPLPQNGNAGGHTKTITLRKGDNLMLIYTGDVLNMDRYDREFLFQLIDEMEDHAREIAKDAIEDEEEIEEEEEV